MSQHATSLQSVFDPFRFAADARRMEGEVAVAALTRLADVLVDGEGMLACRIEGMLDAERRPRLQLSVTGSLVLRCQRCLGGLAWPVRIEVALQPVKAGQEIPEDELENDELDALEVGDELDQIEFIEDEVLLALPIAPRHENCEPPRPDGGTIKESPFAGLAALRGSASKA
jgi:uncharacterized protein